jgi:Domain of unknown function (DUF2017)
MIIRFDEDSAHIEALDPFCTEMFRRLPECAATDDDATSARIFPSLTGGADRDADSDWKDVVEPGLRELFESHVDVVRRDVAAIRTGKDGEEISFPLDHGRAWMHTLNQARLALGARHDVTEEDMQGRRGSEDGDKAFAVMQIEFFGIVLGVLLQRIEI